MKQLEEKLSKAKKAKFLRNILVGIISLIIVAFIINIAPGYKRDKYKNRINLVLDQENKTEELKNEIYVNDNGTVYISEEDVKNLFDDTIYYDEQYNQIITVSDTKVANIVINEKQMTINNVSQNMSDAVIKINDIIYLPISDMTIVYNINVQYIYETKTVIIDNLSKGIIRALVSEETDIKFKPRKLSKNIGTLKEGESVYCFYTTSKGWRKIRTSTGLIGYIKANKLTGEYIVRQDMEERGKAKVISKADYSKNKFEIENKRINVQKLIMNENDLEINNNAEEDIKVWVDISNEYLEGQTNTLLKDYKTRTNLIDRIVNEAVENNIKGIVIDFNKINEKWYLKRFMIELTPKLRELGITTSIVINESMEKSDYEDIVDFIVE